MPLYDFLAPAYDPAFERIYRPFRERAFAKADITAGSCVLEIACGTGQNFPFLTSRLGCTGHLIGVDISRSMLRHAGRRSHGGDTRISLVSMDATLLTSALLEKETGVPCVDLVLCTYGLSSMRDSELAFQASWNVLKPGGGYLVHDIYAEKRTLHARAVEIATHSRFDEATWRPLQAACDDFRMDYLDPSAHLFGGRLFVARGTKPLGTTRPPSCPS